MSDQPETFFDESGAAVRPDSVEGKGRDAASDDRPGAFAELLAAAQRGCESAIARLMSRHRGALWRLAHRESTPALRAKVSPSDLVQETYFEVHRKLAQFTGESEPEFVGWLNSILRSKLATGRRRYRYTRKRALDREVQIAATSNEEILAMVASSTRTPGSQAANVELAAIVREAIERLPHDHQRAIVLRNWEGKSFSEIGSVLERTEEAARKLWARAVERLAAEMEGYVDNEP